MAESMQEIELIDIEDIVPTGGNSLFLSCARAILYLSNKNTMFINAFNICNNIDLTIIKTDIKLQTLLRERLCEYFCINGIVYNNGRFCLREEYSKYFNDNVYDYLIQVYQLSINNFSNNVLYKKFALISLCQLLNMKIYFKRSNGQWKMYEPFTIRHSEKNLKKIASEKYLDENRFKLNPEKKILMNFLNDAVIYLQEFRTDTTETSQALQNFSKRFVRNLLNKKLWMSKFADNSKICMKFSQFNDECELNSYQRFFFTIDPYKITNIFVKRKELYSLPSDQCIIIDLTTKLFCVFIHIVPVHVILNSDTYSKLSGAKIPTTCNSDNDFEMFELNQEFNTIGKQLNRFSEQTPEKLYKYLNHLWGKKLFNDEFVLFKYSLLVND